MSHSGAVVGAAILQVVGFSQMALISLIAAAKRRRNTEEEELTQYPPHEPSEEWEFKILRSLTGQFRDPSWFSQALWEEAKAGWAFVEKFDENRVRVKRLTSWRANDSTVGFDPYRTSVGKPSNKRVWLLAGGIFALAACAILMGLGLAYLFNGHL